MTVLDIYRTFHPKIAEYTFFSRSHETFPRTDYMLGHRISLNKFKNTEIILSIFSDQNDMKLEMNYRKKTGNKTQIHGD